MLRACVVETASLPACLLWKFTLADMGYCSPLFVLPRFFLGKIADGVGGRIRTDQVDGFLLDRGFQVFIEAYPEATRQLDYWPLDLQKFRPGALVHIDGKLGLVSDPFRRPQDLFDSLKAPVGTLLDLSLIHI